MFSHLRILTAVGALVCGFAVGSAQALPFQNGSFEITTAAPPPGGFLTKTTGDTTITGWTVGGPGGSIDHIGTYWQAADGILSIDLNGTGSGSQQSSIYQTFDTVGGALYTVTFALAGNPDGGSPIKAGFAIADGGPTFFTFDITGHSRADMGWEDHSFSFVAQVGQTQSTIIFASLDPTQFGPALDNVRVSVPEPAPLALLGMGLLGLGAIRRRKA